MRNQSINRAKIKIFESDGRGGAVRDRGVSVPPAPLDGCAPRRHASITGGMMGIIFSKLVMFSSTV